MPSASGCLTARRECHPSSPSFSLPSRVQVPRPETRNLQVGVAKRLPTPHHPPQEVAGFRSGDLQDEAESAEDDEHRKGHPHLVPVRGGRGRWAFGLLEEHGFLSLDRASGEYREAATMVRELEVASHRASPPLMKTERPSPQRLYSRRPARTAEGPPPIVVGSI